MQMMHAGTANKSDEATYRERLRRDPGDAGAMHSLAMLLAGRREYGEAGRLLEAGIVLCPLNSDLHNDLGVVLEQAGEYAGAVGSYRRAVEIKPRFYQCWTNLANALIHSGRRAEAQDACRRAIEIEPRYGPAHNALGTALVELGQFQEGIASFRHAISLWPDHAQAHANLGMALLRMGDFANGWREYEWRRKTPNPLFDRPGRGWNGSDPFGQTLLVYGEGGIGNVIQFARYIPILRDLGVRVIVECQPELVPLLSSVRGVWKLSPRGQAPPHHDAHCPLTSLPVLLGKPRDVPAQVPYLQPDAALVERWKEIVRSLSGFRVGVCWHADPSPLAAPGRSFDPWYLSTVAAIPGVTLVCLQHGQPVPADVPMKVLPGLEPGSMRLEDVAAAMMSLDLVITCDTSILHLAGAMGVPCRGALKFPACWRWMLDREDSPWYPSARLFRQAEIGRWEPVFDRVGAELSRVVAGR